MDKLIYFILGIATGGIYKAIDHHPTIKQSNNEELEADDDAEEKTEATTNLDNSSAKSLVNPN